MAIRGGGRAPYSQMSPPSQIRTEYLPRWLILFFIEDGSIHISNPSVHPDFISRMRLKSLTPR
jgi:hypothetical protein